MSVRCPGRAWRAAETALWALTAAVLGLWLGGWLQAGVAADARVADLADAAVWGGAVAWALAALAGGAVVWARGWHLRRTLSSSTLAPVLAWDGQGWLLDGEAVEARLKLASAGGVLVLLKGRDGRRWLGISRAEAGPHWPGLRVALQAHARAGAVPADPADLSGRGA